MTRILFVCHGNICRSPMAEYVMEYIVEMNQQTESFYIASAATSSEELGNPVYPPVKKLLNENGINCDKHKAQRITEKDYAIYDYIIGMDEANIRNLSNLFGGDPDEKIHLLSEYGHFEGEVADPWYTRNFQKTWDQVWDGCEQLYFHIRKSDEK